MAVNRCLVTLHTVDANPANFITNTLYFDDNEDPATNLPLIESELEDAYASMVSYLPETIPNAGHEFQWYKMSDPTPRAPVRETTWSLGSSPSGESLPSEVALVLSFQAPRASGVNQARRRGRIYLGPFNIGATQDSRPYSTVVAAAADFGGELLIASNLADWTWVVFSTVNGTGVDVTNGWVDNAWDTQRRRGIEWTSRTTYGS